MIFLYSLLVISIITLIACTYLLYRNERVHKFRRQIIDDIFSSYNYSDKLHLFYKVSYSEMLYSIKPLKAESFFTPDEINLLKI